MENDNFLALDFETATTDREPCQLGIVIVNNWTIVQKMCYLIQPQNNYYDFFCVKQHGITAIDTKNAPKFTEVWDKVSKYFENSTIVAHNASFDRDVLFKAIDRYGLKIPKCNFVCTHRMTGLNLKDACVHFNIPLPKHHDALCDAEAAANIFIKANKQGLSLANLTSPWNVKENVSKTKENSGYSSFDDELEKLAIIVDETFKGKRFLITGMLETNREDLKSIIKKLGGKISSTVNRTVNFVIIGENPGPAKMIELSNLKSMGVEIMTIDENEILEMIENAFKKQGFTIDNY